MEKYCKRFHDKRKWEETTLEEAVKNISGNGTLDANTARKMLQDGIIVRTPYAIYRKGELGHFNELIDEIFRNQKGPISEGEVEIASEKLKNISDKEMWKQIEE